MRFGTVLGLTVGLIALFADVSFGQQCVNGVCQMRTPVRSTVNAIIEAQPVRSFIQSQPVRSTIQIVRPANWRVLQSNSLSCTSANQSCKGQSVAPTACYNVEQSWIGTQSQVVTRIAPVEEVTALNVMAGGEVSAQGAIRDRIAARRVILESARRSLKKDEITIAQFLLIAGATRNPVTLDKLMASIHESAIEEGMATTQAIDWDGLAAFIEKILPIILQLIQLFG